MRFLLLSICTLLSKITPLDHRDEAARHELFHPFFFSGKLPIGILVPHMSHILSEISVYKEKVGNHTQCRPREKLAVTSCVLFCLLNLLSTVKPFIFKITRDGHEENHLHLLP